MTQLRRQPAPPMRAVRFSKRARFGFARRMLAAITLSACIAVLAPTAVARAEWPERAVKLIVTFPPGSANDAAARIFADALGKKWGKPVGVGSFVSSPDDHALLYTVAGSVTVAPLLVDKLPYDANQD